MISKDSHIIIGLHAVAALLEKQPERVLHLVVSADRQDKKIQTIISNANAFKIPIKKVHHHELDNLSQGANHQGVLLVCKPAKKYFEHDLEEFIDHLNKPALLLVLDNIQDPHNLGAILRSADAAGVDAVIAPKDKSVGITATVSKVASGAAESVPFIQVTNLARTLKLLKEKNIWIYGATGDADRSIYEEKFSGSIAIVLGSEGTGMRRLTQESCDFLIKIPMLGSVSSLNVSVAAGVILFEVVRQRLLIK